MALCLTAMRPNATFRGEISDRPDYDNKGLDAEERIQGTSDHRDA